MDDNPPSPKQLNYLKALAQRTRQTFSWPKTSEQASREIGRLKQARPALRAEVEIEREIADAIAQGEQDAARFRQSEVTGYGSTATWSQRS